MPLPETMGPENEIEPRRLKALGHALVVSIKQAHRRGHLTCGMKACAQLLQSEPEKVMLCVLPTDSNNVAANIHQMLIEAFCHENFVPLLKTDEFNKIESLITKLADVTKPKKAVVHGDAKDTLCLILQCAKLGYSKQDELLCHFNDEMMANPHPLPYLMLPD